jgi:hypothetical protein
LQSGATPEEPELDGQETEAEIRRAIANLLRDIFGNPFRPVTIDPAWRTPVVTAIAHTVYDERRVSDLPVLADALEDAGCSGSDLLAHLRGPGPHVRGCWALDKLLGRE